MKREIGARGESEKAEAPQANVPSSKLVACDEFQLKAIHSGTIKNGKLLQTQAVGFRVTSTPFFRFCLLCCLQIKTLTERPQKGKKPIYFDVSLLSTQVATKPHN